MVIFKMVERRNTSTVEINQEYLNKIREIAHKEKKRVREIADRIFSEYFSKQQESNNKK